ncbi:MAG: hypothetical protein QW518_08630 [Thermofilaceae archaeon]
MGFKPQEWMESQVLRPGVYVVSVDGFEEQVRADGTVRLRVVFRVEDDEGDKELVDWWKEGVAPVARRVMALARLLDPALLYQEYPSQLAFFKAVLEKAKGKLLRVQVVTYQRADGTPAARVNAILGLVEGQPKSRDEVDLPF